MQFLVVSDGTIVKGDTFTDIVGALAHRRRFGPPPSPEEALAFLANGIERLTGTRVVSKVLDFEARCESLVNQAEDAGLLQRKEAAGVSTYEDLRDVLGDLLEWASGMGGWEAECWMRAERLLTGARRNKP